MTTAVNNHVMPYPKAPYLPTSECYQAAASGQPVEIAAYKEYHVARMGFTGMAEIAIDVQDEIVSFSISPRSFGIQAQVEGKRLRFTIEQGVRSQPYYLVIRINKLDNLVLLADPLTTREELAGSGRFVDVVAEYKADPTGAVSSQAAIQQAIDAVHAAGGGTVVLPDGVYIATGLELRSHVKLYLESGAFLRGDSRIEAYTGEWAPYRRNENGLFILPPFIRMNDARHAEILGRGVIDCNNSAVTTEKSMNWRNNHNRRHIVMTDRCSHIRVEGVTVMDSEQWSTRFSRSSHVHVKNYKVLNTLHKRTNDGINMDGTRDSLVEQCFTYVGDDGLNSKASYDGHPACNLHFRDSIIHSGEIGMQLGYENTADIRDIQYENIDVVYSKMPLGMFTNKSCQTEIGEIRNISFTNIRAEMVEPPVWNSHNQSPEHFRSARPFTFWVGLEQSAIRNIHLKDVTILWNNAPRPISIIGLSEQTQASGITFENVVIEGKKLTKAEAPLFLTNEHAVGVVFR